MANDMLMDLTSSIKLAYDGNSKWTQLGNIGTTTTHINKYIDLDALKKFKELLYKDLFSHPTYEHKCHNCGGTVEMDIDNHIFKCPYCRSVYAIGTYMTRSVQ